MACFYGMGGEPIIQRCLLFSKYTFSMIKRDQEDASLILTVNDNAHQLPTGQDSINKHASGRCLHHFKIETLNFVQELLL